MSEIRNNGWWILWIVYKRGRLRTFWLVWFWIVTEEELQKLYKNFSKLDKDKSGTLEPQEFFDIPELANNPLVKRVIAVLDKNKDGSISFLEFVQGLNSLSAGSSQEEKLRFAFQIYDINNDGYISNGELFHVLKMMVGSNLNDVQLQQLVDRTIIKADKDLDGKISFEEFTDMVKDLDVIDKLTISYWAGIRSTSFWMDPGADAGYHETETSIRRLNLRYWV